MILVGITGIVGSGKTLALNFFKSKNIPVFSADNSVKKILKKKFILNKVYKKFPEVFLKKNLNKKKLASIVFDNKNKLRNLEKIIHPYVKIDKQKFIKKNKKRKIVVMEIPIIFEKKSNKNYDYIILMNVNKTTLKKRVLKRKNMTLQLLNNILSNQISNKKKKLVNFIVENNKTKAEAKKKLDQILTKILSTGL